MSGDEREKEESAVSAVRKINAQLSLISQRQEDLERRFAHQLTLNSDSNLGSRFPTPPSNGADGGNGGNRPVSTRSPEGDFVDTDVQGQYQSIRDSVQRIRLPSDLKLNETRRGVRACDKPHFNTLTRSARYVETALKVIASVDDNATPDQLSQLFTILKAHIAYLQDEHAAVVVQGQFDS